MFLKVFRFRPLMLAVAYFCGLKMVFKSAKMARAPRWPQDGIREPQDGPKMTFNSPEIAPNIASVPNLRATAQAGYAKR